MNFTTYDLNDDITNGIGTGAGLLLSGYLLQ
jgi:hypothetical protein